MRSDARENRTLLLHAARAVFSEKGLAAEVKDIAAVAGVGIGTFYRNFATKDELVKALLAEANSLSLTALEEAESSGEPPLNQIRHVLTSSFESVEQYGWLIEALWTGQLPVSWLDQSDTDSQIDRFRAMLEKAVADGELQSGLNINMALGMLSGPIALYTRFIRHIESPEAAAEQLVQLFLNGASAE